MREAPIKSVPFITISILERAISPVKIVGGASARLAGCSRGRRPGKELIHLVHPAVRDHLFHLVRVRQVRERIAVNHDEVGEFTGLDGARVESEPG